MVPDPFFGCWDIETASEICTEMSVQDTCHSSCSLLGGFCHELGPKKLVPDVSFAQNYVSSWFFVSFNQLGKMYFRLGRPCERLMEQSVPQSISCSFSNDFSLHNSRSEFRVTIYVQTQYLPLFYINVRNRTIALVFTQLSVPRYLWYIDVRLTRVFKWCIHFWEDIRNRRLFAFLGCWIFFSFFSVLWRSVCKSG